MTQMNASMTFETRRLEEAITAAVEARLAETVATIVLPGIAQVSADVQRLTKLLEAEAVEPAEFAAVLAHSGAIDLTTATAQAESLTRLGYRLVPGVPLSGPAPVAATWDGPTPPQAVETVTVYHGTGETHERPLWTPPILDGPAATENELRRQNPDVMVPDKAWTAAFE